jgi:transposase-like protein
VSQNRTALFRGRHFEDVIIILCVRWYLRYSLSYRDLEEMMVERGLLVDHVTIWRWVQHYAPILNQRLRREVRHPNGSWRVDETYVRVGGEWAYLYRAVDSAGDTIDFLLSPKRDLTAAKLFLRLALSGTSGIRPRVINLDGHPGICSCHCRAEAVGRSRTTLPMSTITLFKQRHRAGPSIYQEAHCGEPVVPVGRRIAYGRVGTPVSTGAGASASRMTDGYEAMHLIRKG